MRGGPKSHGPHCKDMAQGGHAAPSPSQPPAPFLSVLPPPNAMARLGGPCQPHVGGGTQDPVCVPPIPFPGFILRKQQKKKIKNSKFW